MIRVLFVNHEQHLGGAERMLLSLLGALRGADVLGALAVPGDGDLAAAARGLGIPVIPTAIAPPALHLRRGETAGLGAAWRLVPAAWRLAREIRRGLFDVICTNSMKAHLYGTAAAALARVPSVWRLHDCLDPETVHPLHRTVIASAGRAAGQVLCVSKAVADFVVAAGLPGRKASVIYNGVDLDRFRPVDRPAGEPTVGIVGRLDPMKGHDTFLRAAALVAQRVPAARFVVVGEAQFWGDEYAAALRGLAAELGIAERVSFVGHQADVRPFLAEMDVFVHASGVPDPLPTTVIEAMAMAKAVVGTATGGTPEILDGGRCGVLVPPRNPRTMADAVARLLEHPDDARALASAARRRAEEAFDRPTQNARLIATVAECAAPRRGARAPAARVDPHPPSAGGF